MQKIIIDSKSNLSYTLKERYVTLRRKSTAILGAAALAFNLGIYVSHKFVTQSCEIQLTFIDSIKLKLSYIGNET